MRLFLISATPSSLLDRESRFPPPEPDLTFSALTFRQICVWVHAHLNMLQETKRGLWNIIVRSMVDQTNFMCATEWVLKSGRSGCVRSMISNRAWPKIGGEEREA